MVFRLEAAKLVRQMRVRAATAVCVLAPFLVLLAAKVQSAVPSDTLFGLWLHQSGFALPMVVLVFAGQWALPLLAAIVAGDIFSAEDHFGTWKTVLTRSRTRRQIFAGKTVAAVAYCLIELAVLAASSVAAGVLLGTQPLVGLSGQTIGPGRAGWMVVASWASQAAPMLAFCALAVALSVISCSSPVGIGGPVVVGLVVQVLTFVSLPSAVRLVLPGTAFGSWHGFWTQPAFHAPFTTGVAVSAAWFVGLLTLSWAVFARRAIGAW